VPITSRREGRPRNVEIAYWIWIVAAVLLVLFGALLSTASTDAAREVWEKNGNDPDGFAGYMRMLRGIGIISLVVGLGVGFLARPVRFGDARFRRALVALSFVFALVGLGLVLIGIAPTIFVIVPLLLIAAGVLVYRPSGNSWFTDEQ
jgi:hypothetical protein